MNQEQETAMLDEPDEDHLSNCGVFDELVDRDCDCADRREDEDLPYYEPEAMFL